MQKLKQRIFFWQNVIAKTVGVKREIENEIAATLFSKPIKIITGFRRSGKSFLIRQIAKRYVENGNYSLTNILYLNFEDYNFFEINTADKLGKLYNLFVTEIANHSEKMLLIFDEIQNVKNWDKFIRTIYESENNIEIVITGSNSELLSSELSSNLAGRFVEFFVLPFSFKEFLIYKNVLPDSKNEFYRNHREISALFNEFSSYGGLPEVFEIHTSDAKKSYLTGVLNKVILDDIVKRFNVENIDVLEKILAYLLSSVGNIVSFSKIERLIKSYGLNVCTETIIKYVGYFITTFALFELNKFDWKLNSFFSTTKKYYAVDTGLLTLYRFENENYSFRIENIVFTELLRRNKTINFAMGSNNKEIDFILQDKSSQIETKIQVCIEVNNKNYRRETGSFLLADKYIKNSKNLLLTLGENETLQEKNTEIEQKNILEWLLNI